MAAKEKAAKVESTLLELTSIGVDIGKDVFHIVGFDRGLPSMCCDAKKAASSTSLPFALLSQQ